MSAPLIASTRAPLIPSPRVLKALRRSLLQAIPTVLIIVILNFFLLRLAPGNAADVLAGEAGAATAETMEKNDDTA